MHFKRFSLLASLLALAFHANPSQAYDEGRGCLRQQPVSFVEMQTPNLVFNASGQIVANGLLTLKGKLQLPAGCRERRGFRGLPAVLILHGSSGVDSRGDFHAEALNEAGFATLEIDMWEARGVGSGANRPALPALTYADAFTALRFLSTRTDIDPARIGVLGFSWGAVMSMASATQNVATALGGNLRFKAHAANYPICYGYNNPAIPNSGFGTPGGNPLTGAPILVQVGSQDDYDRANASGDGSARCAALKASLPAGEQALMDVVRQDGAYHGWDRLMVPIKVNDPFGHLGADRFDPYARVELRPDVTRAYASRQRMVRFFQRNL